MMRLLAEQAASLDKGLRLRVQVRGFEVVCRMVQAGLGGRCASVPSCQIDGGRHGFDHPATRDKWSVRQMLTCVKKDRPRTVSLTRLLDALTPPAEPFSRGGYCFGAARQCKVATDARRLDTVPRRDQRSPPIPL